MHEIDHNLNEDLANVTEWLSANKLTLNQSKTEFRRIGSRQRIDTFRSTPLFAINNISVKQVSYTKSLDIPIDEYCNREQIRFLEILKHKKVIMITRNRINME